MYTIVLLYYSIHLYCSYYMHYVWNSLTYKCICGSLFVWSPQIWTALVYSMNIHDDHMGWVGWCCLPTHVRTSVSHGAKSILALGQVHDLIVAVCHSGLYCIPWIHTTKFFLAIASHCSKIMCKVLLSVCVLDSPLHSVQLWCLSGMSILQQDRFSPS